MAYLYSLLDMPGAERALGTPGQTNPRTTDITESLAAASQEINDNLEREILTKAWIEYHQRHRIDPPGGVVYLRRIRGTGLSNDTRAVTTGNSAFAALGLAWHYGASRVAMLGVDCNAEPYAMEQPGRPLQRNGFEHLPRLFASAVAQLGSRDIQVMNGSKFSKVSCFERCPPGRAIEWLLTEG